jgi:hypothetical protein
VNDDALLELADSLAQRGRKPIAGAAYIGEHSFSCPETPMDEGRPDGRATWIAQKPSGLRFGKNCGRPRRPIGFPG